MGYIKLDSYVSERTFSIICEFNMKKIENNPTKFFRKLYYERNHETACKRL